MAVFAGRQGEVKATNGYYVGSGTYGVSNPCSITFDKLPNKIIVEADPTSGAVYKLLIILPGILTNEFTSNVVFNWSNAFIRSGANVYAKCDGKTVSWYCPDDAVTQMSKLGVTYKWWSY